MAQHCVLVEQIAAHADKDLDRASRLAALLHDAPEYVIGDMISPFKSVVGGGYKDVEARLQVAIHQRFGLPPKLTEALKKEIKRADQVAAYFEATELAGFTHAEAAQYFSRPRWISPEKLELEPKPAKAVETAFLKRFKAIQMFAGVTIC